MARRSSLWAEITRDRALRQRQNDRAAQIHRQVARQLEADVQRARRAESREAQAREKERVEAERLTALAQAEEHNARLDARVAELAGVLQASVRTPALSVDEITKIGLTPFDPGDDGFPLPLPAVPVMEAGGLLSRARRRRAYEAAVAQHAAAMSKYRSHERDRLARLKDRREAYQHKSDEIAAEAARKAEQFRSDLADGVEEAVEELAGRSLATLPIPSDIDLDPKVVYRREPREVVVDIQLPDVDALPSEKSVKYVHVRRSFDVKEHSKREFEAMYRSLLASLPLCIVDGLFSVLEADVLDSVTVNGVLPTVDRATGRPIMRYLTSVTTSRSAYEELTLDSPDLDPVQCMRRLGAKLSPHPLDYEEVPPFLTFELAKYRLGPSVDVAAEMDGRIDISTMEWGSFEQLVRQLLHKMTGVDARVTRRSRDDGIDGVLFDGNAVHGGEFVVQAKRYRKVVPANDIRALAGVMHDKRANHAIFVTTAWFSDDGRRFALNNRVRLIEGPELKHLLRVHLGLDVLVSSVRRQRRNR